MGVVRLQESISSTDQGGANRQADTFASCYFQLSEGPKSRSSFCNVSRRDVQYFTIKSGPRARKSCSIARRQRDSVPSPKPDRPAASGGKIDSKGNGARRSE